MLLAGICVSSLMLLAAPALAKKSKPPLPPGQHLNITNVLVQNDFDTIVIMGTDFDFGGPLNVYLGGSMLVGDITANCMLDPLPTMITCTFPSGLPDAGDYLLTISTGNGQSQGDEYDLTIGAAGQQGEPGPAGADGVAGPPGPQGANGVAGPPGPQGAVGAVGPPGPQGAVGPQGPVGANGTAGPQGPVGAMGLPGPQGPVGAAGPKGDDGAVGPQGPQGDDGAVGPQGPSGSVSATYVVEGAEFMGLATEFPQTVDAACLTAGDFVTGCGGKCVNLGPEGFTGPTGSFAVNHVEFRPEFASPPTKCLAKCQAVAPTFNKVLVQAWAICAN